MRSLLLIYWQQGVLFCKQNSLFDKLAFMKKLRRKLVVGRANIACDEPLPMLVSGTFWSASEN